MILVVTYDLKQPAASYEPLFEALKSQDSWAHYMSSTWLVATEDSPNELWDKLGDHIFKGDRMLITRLAPGYHGWMPTKAWEWIKRHKE
jgi:hypothetical protein